MFKEDLPCVCFDNDHPCVCSQRERVLRHYAFYYLERKMSDEERQWCIEEADSAGEGYYSSGELSKMTDKELAYAVLKAWNMYVQDMF
jgi:hypothetical protein